MAEIDPARAKRATWTIAAATGIGSTAGNVWFPFLPLYLFEVGARDAADALYWFALALAAQGVSRLACAPLWGMLSDRVGRKAMFVRALVFLSITTVIVAFIQSPWQLIIALAFQGAFSGFSAAAVALTSVSVPDSQMRRSLSWVSGALHLGSMLGPSVGALLALGLGYRGAILAAAAMTMAVGLLVYRTVPADSVEKKQPAAEPGGAALEPFAWSAQLLLALFLLFALQALQMLIRAALPIALRDEAPAGQLELLVGIAFTLGSVGSLIGVMALSSRIFRTGQLRWGLALGMGAVALAFVSLAASGAPAVYLGAYFVLCTLFGAMTPPNNTLIALNIPRARRGTAFGFAGSAQALAFMAGPLAAAAFPAITFSLGFIVTAAVSAALGLALALALREPREDHGGEDID